MNELMELGVLFSACCAMWGDVFRTAAGGSPQRLRVARWMYDLGLHGLLLMLLMYVVMTQGVPL